MVKDTTQTQEDHITVVKEQSDELRTNSDSSNSRDSSNSNNSSEDETEES